MELVFCGKDPFLSLFAVLDPGRGIHVGVTPWVAELCHLFTRGASAWVTGLCLSVQG